MKVTIFSNSFWNLYNFRLNLIKFFIEKNIKVNLIASDDKYSDFFNCHRLEEFILVMNNFEQNRKNS